MVDTDILVDALRRFSVGLDYVEEASQQGTLRIRIISEMELIMGCRNRRELYRLERFLRRCTILAMTETIAARAVTLLRQYRLSHGLSITDALRGYPETFSHCCSEIKQHSDGNEMQGDRRDRAC